MRKVLKLEPDGFPCRFEDCPPGFFLDGDEVCLKTEYSGPGNAYCSSGETYWGGTSDKAERDAKIIQPLKEKWDTEDQ